MNDNYSNRYKRSGRPGEPFDRSAKDSSRRAFTPAEIVNLFREHPELRLDDDPANMQLAEMLMGDLTDQDLQEMFALVVDTKRSDYLKSNDWFWGNYPPPGSISYPADFMAIGQMPTGDQIGLTLSQLTGNVGILGPTKSGKTTLLSILLSYRQFLEKIRIVALVKKPELRHLVTLNQVHDLILVFRRNDLQFCLCEPPEGVPESAWTGEITRLIGQCYARFSSQRLFGDIVNDVMASHPEGVYPTLRQLSELIDRFKPRSGMREAAYKESILWVLKDLLNNTGNIWDYSSSDFLEHLFSAPGLAIIELEDVQQEHFTFIATYMMRWIYFKQLYGGQTL